MAEEKWKLGAGLVTFSRFAILAGWSRCTPFSAESARTASWITESMEFLPQLEAKATGTEFQTAVREGSDRSVSVKMAQAFAAWSDRHVETVRDDLSEIAYAAGKNHVEYVFDDSILPARTGQH